MSTQLRDTLSAGLQQKLGAIDSLAVGLLETISLYIEFLQTFLILILLIKAILILQCLGW